MGRILHVVSRYWPYTGGSERHLQEFAERQTAEGHEVTVLTTDAWDLELFWNPAKRRIELAAAVHNGVVIRRFAVRHLPLPQVAFPGVRRLMSILAAVPGSAAVLSRLGGLTPYVPELRRWLGTTDERFDLVHGMNICFESLLEPALAFARRTGARFAITPLTHLGEPNDDSVRRFYTMPHQIALIRAADAVLAQTEIERRFLAARGVSTDRIATVGVGVNPQQLAGGDGARFRQSYGLGASPIVFYLGTAAYDKGTVHLVQAMEMLWERGVDAELVLAGPVMDPFRAFLDARPPATRRRTRLLGFIPEADKRDLLAAGTAMAMPSRTDSLGIVYLEAWLYNTPVIGAAAGGVPEVIADGVDGFLVPFGDVPALAVRLERLLRDPALALRLGSAGREKVLDRYTWDRLYPKAREAFRWAKDAST